MPYSLPEAQREYQRNWAKRKRVASIQNGYVTWEQLTETAVAESLHSYKECVEAAKSYIVGRKINRLAVAALAIRSCVVIHGGDRRSEFCMFKNMPTIKKFALDIGVKYGTLCDWISIQKKIIEVMPDHLRQYPIDMAAAGYAIRGNIASPEIAITKYEEMLLQPHRRLGFFLFKNLQSTATVCKKGAVRGLSDSQRARCLSFLQTIQKSFSDDGADSG